MAEPLPQTLRHFSAEAVRKCVPSIARSRRPGGADCVDLVVRTAHGTRELRLRCASGADVRSILAAVAMDIVQPKAAASRGSSRTTSYGGSSHGGGRPTLSGSGNSDGCKAPDAAAPNVPPGLCVSVRSSRSGHGARVPDALMADEPLHSRRMATLRSPHGALQHVQDALLQARAQADGEAPGSMAARNVVRGRPAPAPPLHPHTHARGAPLMPWEQAAEEANAALNSEHGGSSGGSSGMHSGGGGGGGRGGLGVLLPDELPALPEEAEPPSWASATPTLRRYAASAGGVPASAGGAGADSPPVCDGQLTRSQLEVQAHSDFQLQLLKQEAAASKAGAPLGSAGVLRVLRARVGGHSSGGAASVSWGSGAGGREDDGDALPVDEPAAAAAAALRAELAEQQQRCAGLEGQVARMAEMLEEWARESLATAQECVAASAARATAERTVQELLAALEGLRGADADAADAAARADAAAEDL
eukprot:83910-Chlamydomonas_euryale.AAC.1